jgi:7,8-dihydropterin-6-yl-methyl-4-(beta-D-ribofuranosyl)aminobenzene 5'-phosphate synthase
MKITIVYDNCAGKRGLETGWGFSSLIESEDTAPLLFDTGADGAFLLSNMKRLGIDPSNIGVIVISHYHHDHTGGLSGILETNKRAVIYAPVSTDVRLKDRKVVRVSEPAQISENIYTTGELGGIEQALVTKTSRGIVVVTGCSHPGVGKVLEAASCHGKVYGIIGGLHGFRDFNRFRGLSLICPCHCTQYKQELRNLFPEQYVSCGAGLELEL